MSGKFSVLLKRAYAISLYRCGVSIAVVGGKLRFLSGRHRDLWHSIFSHSFCFLGANYCNLFYDCSNFGSLGEVFAHGGEFPLAFLKVGGLGHGVENYC